MHFSAIEIRIYCSLQGIKPDVLNVLCYRAICAEHVKNRMLSVQAYVPSTSKAVGYDTKSNASIVRYLTCTSELNFLNECLDTNF